MDAEALRTSTWFIGLSERAMGAEERGRGLPPCICSRGKRATILSSERPMHWEKNLAHHRIGRMARAMTGETRTEAKVKKGNDVPTLRAESSRGYRYQGHDDKN